MVKDMKILCLLILVVGATHSFEYEHVEDSCNSIARYMSRKPDDYTLRFSKEPEEELQICNSGTSCCTTLVEEHFYNDTKRMVPRISFYKDPYLRKLTQGTDNLADYMTQVLTMAVRSNQRTKTLVDDYLKMTKYQTQTIDVMQYPVFILLDIAESHGVTNLLNNTDCIAEMRDYLHPLATMQTDALEIGRLLYQSIPVGTKVLTVMKDQAVSDDCIKHLVKSQKCNECRDSTHVKPCKSYCMAIAEQCFSHLTAIASDWENFAKMTSDSMDKLDKFAKVYEDALTQSINKIVEKLRDHDTADMCGYDVSANLAAKHKRSTDSRRTSKTRKALFDETFLTGMIGKLDEIHCQRYSTQEIKCWNGTTVGLFTGSSKDISVTNDATVTPELTAALEQVAEYNEKFAGINEIEIEGVQYNIIYATETPDFVRDKDNGADAMQIALSFLGLSLVSLLLH